MENKIPKIIHWCWLSNDPLPERLKACINSWYKVMPDYKIICWDKTKFDINSVPFVKEAYENKKYAFAADYIRLYALYNIGGIYFDSDVYAYKRLDEFLDHSFFSSIEQFKYLMTDFSKYVDKNGNRINFDQSVPGMGIQAAMIGATKGHPLIKDCLEYLSQQKFIQPDGSTWASKMVAPALLATFAEKYGFKYINKYQNLNEDIVIYPAHELFGGFNGDVNYKTVAEHKCAGSWHDKVSLWERIILRIKQIVSQ